MDEKSRRVSEAVLNAFQNYSWPGNVREMRNTLERAVIVCDGAVIETKHFLRDSGTLRSARRQKILTQCVSESEQRLKKRKDC